jgi:serine phosphatase RsbU (regulator of sigma subunit)
MFFDFYEPANHIGGDYYDYIQLADGRLGIVVADVVGHGVAAALLMSKLSASVRFCFAMETEPAKALTRLNRTLAPETFDGRFVTFVMSILDPAKNEVTVVNAGHMAPLLRRRDGSVEDLGLAQSGLPLMVDCDTEYQQCQDNLQPGDCLLLFTDGITEAINPAGELYGNDRLRKMCGEVAPRDIGERVIQDVENFMDGHPAKDDMCLVCVGRLAEAPSGRTTVVKKS